MKIEKVAFEYEGIHFISKEQFDDHMKLYSGYVDKINEIDTTLKDPDEKFTGNATYSKYRGLKKGETFAINGVILHELYFSNCGGMGEPESITIKAVNETFGDYKKWMEDFKNCAQSARGWCIFGYDQRSGSFRNIVLDFHDQGYVAGFFPLIVLDMYEHAYFYDYQTDKSSYISNFLTNINWQAVEKRCALLQL